MLGGTPIPQMVVHTIVQTDNASLPAPRRPPPPLAGLPQGARLRWRPGPPGYLNIAPMAQNRPLSPILPSPPMGDYFSVLGSSVHGDD